MVINGTTAQVNLGGTRRFITGASTTVGAVGGATSSSLESDNIPIGQNVAVNPRILPNNVILLGLNFLDQQIANVQNFTSTVGNVQLPETATRAISTALMVRDGEAVIIGGLRRTTDTETESRLPLLSHLPFIGRNFGNFTDVANSNELVVVIKATIIRPEDLGVGPNGGGDSNLVPVVIGPPVESAPAGG
jgi:type II secretory pathway component GspD/PulD (secretin)